MSLLMTHARIARLGIDRKQFIDARHQLRCYAILRAELERVEYLPARMRPTGSMHHADPARAVISRIAIGLQYPFIRTEEFHRTFPPAPHPEVKDDTAARLIETPVSRSSITL